MYADPDTSPWRGREDSEDGPAGKRWHQQVQFTPPPDPGVSLLGLASDLGVILNKGRAGAAQGPRALRAALANMAWHLPTSLYDAGDIVAQDNLDTAQRRYATRMTQLLDAGHFVVGVGGGHEIGWGSFLGCRGFLDQQAHREVTPTRTLGILNFDAHFDLRTPAPQPSSGTPFYQVAQHCNERGEDFHYACLGVAATSNTRALFDKAEELEAEFLLDTACNIESARALLRDFLARVDCLYLTLCLDVLPADRAPGVSAPAALGVDPLTIIAIIDVVGELCREFGVHWLACDLAELSPPHDQDQRTAQLAARLANELLRARFPTEPGASQHPPITTVDG